MRTRAEELLFGIVLGLALCAVCACVAVAQQPDPWDYRAPDLTRAQLQEMLVRYEAASRSAAYSERLRTEARTRADTIRARLSAGDIRVGDRVRMTVDGQAQLSSDTFAVTAGPALELPVVGTVALRGVLRSELGSRISSAVDSVYRGSAVRVQLLTRLAVIGGVAHPGFYALPRGALVDDAIGAAGGLAPEGRLAEAYIERGGDRVWGMDSLQIAMRQRRTIGDLGLQAGDRIVVPTALPSNPLVTAQVISYVVSLPLSFYALLRLF